MNDLRNEQRWMGNLGKDPEIQWLPSGTPKVTFAIAVDTREKGEDGKWVKGKPMWVDIIAYGSTAELVNRLLKKGSQIYAKTAYQKRRVETEDGPRVYHNFILRDFIVTRWPDRDGSFDGGFDYEPDDDDEDFPF